jgi:hypothetical protein
MSKLPNACAGSGKAVPGGVALLTYAAAPTFALMAIWSGLSSGQPDICRSGPEATPLSGMAAMYALMSLFHTPVWLQLVSARKRALM